MNQNLINSGKIYKSYSFVPGTIRHPVLLTYYQAMDCLSTSFLVFFVYAEIYPMSHQQSSTSLRYFLECSIKSECLLLWEQGFRFVESRFEIQPLNSVLDLGKPGCLTSQPRNPLNTWRHHTKLWMIYNK